MSDKVVIFNIDGVDVQYVNKSMGGIRAPHDHYELRSLNISETGYKSHFVPTGEVLDAGGYMEYAKQLIQLLWIESDNQLELF